MFIKICPQCKKEFQAKKRCRKYCSQRCQWDAKKKPLLNYIVEKKICSKCKKEKSAKDFWKQSGTRDGLHSWCKDCKKQKSKTIVYNCIDCGKEIKRKKFKYQYREFKKICPQCSIKRVLQKNGGRPCNYKGTDYYTGKDYTKWKSSAKKRKKGWFLTKKDLNKIYENQKGICALSGVKMETFSNSPYRISIDRIDSSKPYTVENVQFICSIVNVMKNKYPEDVFIEMCNKITEYNK